MTVTRTRGAAAEGTTTIVGDRRKLARLAVIVVDAFADAAGRGDRIDVRTYSESEAFVLRAAGRTAAATSAQRRGATRGPAAARAEIPSLLIDRLARVHRGTATWSVDAEGRDTLEVRLPRGEPRRRPRRGGKLLGGVRVLVYEPDHDTRELAMLQLRARGAKVLGAREPGVAAAGVAGFRPDVVVANVRGVLEDGVPLIERIGTDATVAIVGLAASAAETNHALLAVVDETVAPFDRDAVGAVLRTAMTTRARIDED